MFDRPKPTVSCSANGRRRRRWAGVITVMNITNSVTDGGNLLTRWATRCVDLSTAQFSASSKVCDCWSTPVHSICVLAI